VAEGQEEYLQALVNQYKGKRGHGCWSERCRGLVTIFIKTKLIGRVGGLWIFLSLVGTKKMKATPPYC